jgi:rare lipoprotein A
MMKIKLVSLITTIFALSSTSFISNFTPRATASNLRRSLNTRQKISPAIVDRKISNNLKSRSAKNPFKSNNRFKLPKLNSSFVKNSNSKFPKQPQSIQIAQAVASGEASWYGPGFHGRTTANGEVFNQNELTAAHPNLPFGTQVKVTNMNNGRSVVVRINDRGPYAGGRIIDLSAAAARVLGLITSGVAPVQLEILGR